MLPLNSHLSRELMANNLKRAALLFNVHPQTPPQISPQMRGVAFARTIEDTLAGRYQLQCAVEKIVHSSYWLSEM